MAFGLCGDVQLRVSGDRKLLKQLSEKLFEKFTRLYVKSVMTHRQPIPCSGKGQRCPMFTESCPDHLALTGQDDGVVAPLATVSHTAWAGDSRSHRKTDAAPSEPLIVVVGHPVDGCRIRHLDDRRHLDCLQDDWMNPKQRYEAFPS